MRRRILATIVLTSVLLSGSAGCGLADLRTQDRLERGLVLVLPGIEGRSLANYNIARGLDDGGVHCGIEIVDWGTAVPGGMLINLTDYSRNQTVADAIRDRIVEYQRAHPGRPIHVIGHSGGAGIALMAVERLPKDRPVSTLICIAGAISPRHDLRKALQRVSGGMYNFYSKMDVGLLGAGTSAFGTIDRDYGAAAGAVGFETVVDAYPEERALREKLHQVGWSAGLIVEGHDGGHFGWTHRGIVAKHLAPAVLKHQAPLPVPRRGG